MHHFIYPSKDTYISNRAGYAEKNFGIDELLQIGTSNVTTKTLATTRDYNYTSNYVNEYPVQDFTGIFTGSLKGIATVYGNLSGLSLFTSSYFSGSIDGEIIAEYSGSISGSLVGFLSSSLDTDNTWVGEFTGQLTSSNGCLTGTLTGTETRSENYWVNTTAKYIDRSLLHFDLTSIFDAITSGLILNPKFHLKLKVCKEYELPIAYSIYALPISQSWNMGDGYFSDGGSSVGASWRYKDCDSGTQWYSPYSSSARPPIDFISNPAFSTGSFEYGGGTWYSGSSCSQSFNYEASDIDMDVTSIVEQWLTGSMPNEGFILLHSEELQSTGSGFTLMFYSRDTNTIYSPYLDVMWMGNGEPSGSNFFTTGSFSTGSVTITTASVGINGKIQSGSTFVIDGGVNGTFSASVFAKISPYYITQNNSLINQEVTLFTGSFTGSLNGFAVNVLGTLSGSGIFTSSYFSGSIDLNPEIYEVSNNITLNTYAGIFDGTFTGSLDGVALNASGTLSGSGVFISEYFSGSIDINPRIFELNNAEISSSFINALISGSITGSISSLIGQVSNFTGSLSGNVNGGLDGVSTNILGTLSGSGIFTSSYFSGSVDYVLVESNNIGVSGSFVEGLLSGSINTTGSIYLFNGQVNNFTGSLRGSLTGSLNGTFNTDFSNLVGRGILTSSYFKGSTDSIPFIYEYNNVEISSSFINALISGSITGSISSLIGQVSNFTGSLSGSVSGPLDGVCTNILGTLSGSGIFTSSYFSGSIDYASFELNDVGVSGSFIEGLLSGSINTTGSIYLFNGQVDNFTGSLSGSLTGSLNGTFNTDFSNLVGSGVFTSSYLSGSTTEFSLLIYELNNALISGSFINGILSGSLSTTGSVSIFTGQLSGFGGVLSGSILPLPIYISGSNLNLLISGSIVTTGDISIFSGQVNDLTGSFGGNLTASLGGTFTSNFGIISGSGMFTSSYFSGSFDLIPNIVEVNNVEISSSIVNGIISGSLSTTGSISIFTGDVVNLSGSFDGTLTGSLNGIATSSLGTLLGSGMFTSSYFSGSIDLDPATYEFPTGAEISSSFVNGLLSGSVNTTGSIYLFNGFVDNFTGSLSGSIVGAFDGVSTYAYGTLSGSGIFTSSYFSGSVDYISYEVNDLGISGSFVEGLISGSVNTTGSIYLFNGFVDNFTGSLSGSIVGAFDGVSTYAYGTLSGSGIFTSSYFSGSIDLTPFTIEINNVEISSSIVNGIISGSVNTIGDISLFTGQIAGFGGIMSGSIVGVLSGASTYISGTLSGSGAFTSSYFSGSFELIPNIVEVNNVEISSSIIDGIVSGSVTGSIPSFVGNISGFNGMLSGSVVGTLNGVSTSSIGFLSGSGVFTSSYFSGSIDNILQIYVVNDTGISSSFINGLISGSLNTTGSIYLFMGQVTSSAVFLSGTVTTGQYLDLYNYTISGIVVGEGLSGNIDELPIIGNFKGIVSGQPYLVTGPCGNSFSASFVTASLTSGIFSGSTFTTYYIDYKFENAHLTGSWTEAALVGSTVWIPLPSGIDPYAYAYVTGVYVYGTAMGDYVISGSISGSVGSDSASFSGQFINGPLIGGYLNVQISGSVFYTSSYSYTSSVEMISSSFYPLNTNKAFNVSLQSVRPTYKTGDIAKIGVFGRKQYPLKTFGISTQQEQYVIPEYLPTSSFYALKDHETGEIIVDFDNYTQLSCEYPEGNYFVIDTTGIPQERYYRVLIRVENGGRIYTTDTGKTFKLTR